MTSVPCSMAVTDGTKEKQSKKEEEEAGNDMKGHSLSLTDAISYSCQSSSTVQ